jgi:hypothetical protein
MNAGVAVGPRSFLRDGCVAGHTPSRRRTPPGTPARASPSPAAPAAGPVSRPRAARNPGRVGNPEGLEAGSLLKCHGLIDRMVLDAIEVRRGHLSVRAAAALRSDTAAAAGCRRLRFYTSFATDERRTTGTLFSPMRSGSTDGTCSTIEGMCTVFLFIMLVSSSEPEHSFVRESHVVRSRQHRSSATCFPSQCNRRRQFHRPRQS